LGQKRPQHCQKVDAKKQAQLSIDNVREQVLQDVDSTFRRLREAREMLTAAQAARVRKPKAFATRWTPIRTTTIVLSDSCSNSLGCKCQRTSIGKVYLAFWRARADFERALGEE